MNRFEYIKKSALVQSEAMLAVLQDKPGDPDVLYLGKTNQPTLGDNEVLIKVSRQTKLPRDMILTANYTSGGLSVCQQS